MSRSPFRRGVLAVTGALLATASLWVTARVAGIDLRIDPRNGQPSQVISPHFAVAVTLAVSLIGWGTRALLERITSRAPAIWMLIALTTLAVSFVPLFLVGASGATKAILAAMHLGVGVALIPVFGRRASR